MSTGLLGFEEVQQRQGGPLAYVSPSRLSCWLSCPLKWAFRYRDGLRTPTTPASLLGRRSTHRWSATTVTGNWVSRSGRTRSTGVPWNLRHSLWTRRR